MLVELRIVWFLTYQGLPVICRRIEDWVVSSLDQEQLEMFDAQAGAAYVIIGLM